MLDVGAGVQIAYADGFEWRHSLQKGRGAVGAAISTVFILVGVVLDESLSPFSLLFL